MYIYIYGQRPHQDLPISFFNGIYGIKCIFIYIYIDSACRVLKKLWPEALSMGRLHLKVSECF